MTDKKILLVWFVLKYGEKNAETVYGHQSAVSDLI